VTGSGTALVRVVGAAGVSAGVVLLVRGVGVWDALEGRSPSAGERLAMRLLGGRHLLQGLAELGAPDTWRPLWAVVDVTHAASMIAVAARQPARRRAALLSAGIASASGLATVVSSRLGPGGPR
jgi:hypothetical protein